MRACAIGYNPWLYSYKPSSPTRWSQPSALVLSSSNGGAEVSPVTARAGCADHPGGEGYAQARQLGLIKAQPGPGCTILAKQLRNGRSCYLVAFGRAWT